MMRDFSPGAKDLLMQYVDDVIASGVWETIENGKGEFNQAGQDWLSKLGISDYLDNMEGYYQNIISKHSTTKEEIEQIFSDVQQVDTRYIGTVAGLVTAGNAIITYFTDLADNINPNGGNLDIEKLRTTLEADRERLDQMQQSVVRNLIKDGKAEEARKSTDLTNLVMIFGLQKISLKILCKASDLPVIRWTALVHYTLHRQDDMMPELADLSVKTL